MFNRNEYNKKYYQKNKDKYKGYVKKYQQSDKGKNKIQEYKKEYEQRPYVKLKRKEYDKKRYTEENKLYRTINKQIRRCIFNLSKKRKYFIQDFTDFRYREMYGIDLHKIIDHLKPIPKDIENYDLDHIIPIIKFDLSKKEEISKAYNPKNLRLILKEKNQKKSCF